MSKLRLRNAELEKGKLHIKKSGGLLRATPTVNITGCYQFMEKQNRYSKAKWARQLGVSTSGYYVWLQTRSTWQERYKTCKGSVISALKEFEILY